MEVLESKIGTKTQVGKVYVSKPDNYLFVHEKKISLPNGPRENLFRPSIDVLFRPAGVAYGNCCVGIFLTVCLNDGTARIEAVKKCDGLAVIQDPATVEFNDMSPKAAETVAIDYVVNIEDMSGVITKIIQEDAPTRIDLPVSIARENKIAIKIGQIALEDKLEKQVSFSCSTCDDSLWVIEDSKVNRYRCHVGHVYFEEALLKSQNNASEDILWIAKRTLEKKKMLLERVYRDCHKKGVRPPTTTHSEKTGGVQEQINKLRNVLQIPD